MRTSRIMLWSIALVAASGAVALTPVPSSRAAETATVVSVSPENYHDFLGGGVEYLKDIDITFADAAEVTLNDGIIPQFALVGATGAFPASGNPSYLISDVSTSVIDGGVRIQVKGKGTYGNDDGLSPAPTASYLLVKVPAGMATVKGADGVERANEEMVLRYTFDNLRRVNPIGIDDYAAVSLDQLASFDFPETLLVNSTQVTYGYQLWSYPNGQGAARKIEGRFILAANGKGQIHAEYEGTYVPTGTYTGEYTGPISDLAEGDYYLVASSQMMFKDANDKVQRAAWMVPITIVKAENTPMTLSLAGVAGDSYEGADMPAFALSVAGDVSICHGNTVTAKVGTDIYALEAQGNTLRFTAADNQALVDRYMNGEAVNIAVEVPAGGVNVVSDGHRYANTEKIEYTCSAKIVKHLDIAAMQGTYYAKYMTVSKDGAEYTDGGWPVVLSYSDEKGMMEFINLLGDNDIAGDAIAVVQSPLAAYVDAVSRAITFPVQAAMYEGEDYYLATADLDEGDLVSARVDAAGDIHISGFVLTADMKTKTLECTEMVLVKDDGVTPAVPVFTAAVGYAGAEKYTLVGTATVAEGNVTALEVYAGDELVYVDRRINGGESVNFEILAAPVAGTVYSLTARVVNGSNASAATTPVEIDFNPISSAEIEGDYYLTSFAGKASVYHTSTIEVGPVLADAAGDFAYDLYDMQMYIDGKVREGKCTVFFQGMRPGFEPAGVLDLLTGAITFEKDNAFVMSYKDTNPDTGELETYTAAFKLVSQDNVTGDVTKNKPVAGTLSHDGVLNIGGWELIVEGELYNDVYVRCPGIVAVRNAHVAPVAPEIKVNAAPDGSVSGTVTLAATDINGAAIAPANGGMAVTVCRVDDGAEVTVAQQERLSAGDVIAFTDGDTVLKDGAKATYRAYAIYLGAISEAAETVAESTSGIADIVTAGETADIYTPLGVCVLRGATADAIGSLAPGVYVTKGRKFIVK